MDEKERREAVAEMIQAARRADYCAGAIAALSGTLGMLREARKQADANECAHAIEVAQSCEALLEARLVVYFKQTPAAYVDRVREFAAESEQEAREMVRTIGNPGAAVH